MVCPAPHISLWSLGYEALKIIASLSFFVFFIHITSFQPMQSKKQQYTIIQKEQTNNRMAMLTTTKNTTTLTTSTMKSPLKCLHNEWSHLGHLQHPDEAAKEILDFIQALSAHGVCYALTAQNPTQCNCLAPLSSRLEPSQIRWFQNSLLLHAKQRNNNKKF